MPKPTDFRDIVARITGFLSDGYSSAEKVVKPSNLKRLYVFLAHLSSNHQLTCPEVAASFNPSDAVVEIAGVKLKSRDINDLSNILYKELNRRFDEFFSALSDRASPGRATGLESFMLNFEVVDFLLRCCMAMLPLMVCELALLVEKGRVLLSILRRLITLEVVYANGDCTSSVTEKILDSICMLKPSHGPSTFACALLEVFADELLVRRSLCRCLVLIDSASSRSEMLFKCYTANRDVGILFEVICAHFILSGFHGLASDGHLAKILFWCHENHDKRTPEIHLQAALSLLTNPVIDTAPKMLQAYLILLIAEATGVRKPGKNEKVVPAVVVASYFSAFERSVVLYARFVPSLCMDRHHFCASGGRHEKLSRTSNHQLATFDSFLQAGTKDILYHLIARLNRDWFSSVSNVSSMSNIVASSVAYVKESLFIFEECHRNQILGILTCIVHECSSDANEEGSLFQSEGETSYEDMVFLASILKLMTSSMLQTVWFLQRCPSTANAYRDSIVKSASHFVKFSIDLPVQRRIHDEMMASDDLLVRHKESKSMLLHFSGLLSFSYSTKLDFLIKDCLLMIMASLSLFLVQDGSLDAIQSAVQSRLQPPLFESPPAEKLPAVCRNSKKIAARIQQIQDMYLRTPSLIPCDQRKRGSRVKKKTASYAKETNRTCNGEAFLKSVYLGANPTEYEDITDFVECEQGKDYSSWLKVRLRYRVWKNKKAKSRKLKRRNMLLGRLAGK